MRVTRSRIPLASLLAVTIACGGGGSDPSTGNGVVTGTVRRSGTEAPLAGVSVAVGAVTTTSGADGSYTLTDVPTGTRTISATAPGYNGYSAQVAVAVAGSTHDIALVPTTLFRSDTAALYIPATVTTVRSVIVCLTRFDTRPVATGQFTNSETGTALQAYRQALRDLLTEHGVALMGITPIVAADNASMANAITSSLADIAGSSGHPELASVPVFPTGFSQGAAPTYAFVHEQPQRSLAFFTWISMPQVPNRSAAAQQVPGAIMLAERDSVADNAEIRRWFDANRAEGALWSIGVQPRATHDAQNAAATAQMVEWIDEVLSRRLPPGAAALVALQENDGWVGDLSTLAIAARAQYAGDPLAAAWLPSQASAEQWRSLVTGVGAP